MLKKVIFYSLFFTSFFIFSQTKEQVKEIKKANNTQQLKNIEESTKLRLTKAKAKALAMAQIKGWPITYVENGSFHELMKVSEDNEPIYYKTLNQNAAISTRVNHLNTGGSLGLELDGQGMVAYIWDSNPALETHQEFDGNGGENRLSVVDDIQTNYERDHGTHVTGTIIASGVNPDAKGMAPYATALGYNWTNDTPEAAEAAENGMLLSNHSYGYQTPPDEWYGAYLTDARDYDEIMYNAPYYLQVVAAGNDGASGTVNENPLDGNALYDKLSGMATSKNNITVANGRDAVIDLEGNLVSMNRNTGSSEGPTDDLRIKPDITGNGTGVFSPIGGLDISYGTFSGTSMASPNVMGSLLLLQEHHQNLNGSFMKAATLKGLALHTADDITPDISNENTQSLIGPDATTGWGLMNTKVAAETISNNGFSTILLEETLLEGNTFTLTVNSDGLSPLLASISWTDVAGEIASGTANDTIPSLVNDLDIRITQVIEAETSTFLPWKLTSVETNEQGDNIVDPYERIDIDNASGAYTITVSHKGDLVNDLQNFSLIVTGSISDINITSTNPSVIQCSTTDAVFKFDYQQLIETTTTISVDNLPTGVSAVISPSSISTDGEIVITVSGLQQVPAGVYDISVTATNGDEIHTKQVELKVVHPDFIDNPMSLTYPSNSETGILPAEIIFQWEDNINAESYTIQVSDNPSFTNILATGTQTDVTFTATGFDVNSIYYWRVNPINQCGIVMSTEIFSFQTTQPEECSNTYIATDFSNYRLSPGSSNSSASLPILIEDDLIISRLIVSSDITHLAVGELELVVQEPEALGSNDILLLQNACGEVPNITTAIFDDEGLDLDCGTSDPAITGTIIPSQSLASSAGKSSLGTWLLIARDGVAQNAGQFVAGYLVGASITVCSVQANSSVPNFVNNTINVTANGASVFTTSDIEASTPSQTAVQQVYTIVTLPIKGSITKNGATMIVGETYTQADVNSGIMGYTNSQTTLFTDSFKVDITNSVGGWLPNQFVNLEATTLSSNLFNLSNVSIYPNPSNGIINVRFETISNDIIKIALYDLQGRNIYSSNHINNQSLFDEPIATGKLSNGVYLLKVSQGNRSATKRVIIFK